MGRHLAAASPSRNFTPPPVSNEENTFPIIESNFPSTLSGLCWKKTCTMHHQLRTLLFFLSVPPLPAQYLLPILTPPIPHTHTLTPPGLVVWGRGTVGRAFRVNLREADDDQVSGARKVTIGTGVPGPSRLSVPRPLPPSEGSNRRVGGRRMSFAVLGESPRAL